MCCLRNIAMRDYQESVTTGQTDRQTDRQTPDKVSPTCLYASQVTQKPNANPRVLKLVMFYLKQSILIPLEFA